MLKWIVSLFVAAVVGASAVCGASGTDLYRCRVVDLDGKPIARARVSVFALEDGTDHCRVDRLTADAQGRFSYRLPFAPKDGNAHFRAVADGYSYGMVDIGPENRGKEAHITLWPEYRLAGKVVDEAGKPIAGARVVLDFFASANWVTLANSWTSVETIQTITEKDGSYTLPHMASPDSLNSNQVAVRLSVSARGRALTEAAGFSRKEPTAPVTIVLPRECVIEGRVRLPDGRGFAPKGTRLKAMAMADGSYISVSTQVGRNGRYRFSALSPTRIQIALAGNATAVSLQRNPNEKIALWLLPIDRDLTLTPGEHRKLDLQLINGVLLNGRVLDKSTGKPYPNASVRLSHAAANYWTPYDTVVTDSQGAFVSKVAPGKVGVDVYQIGDTRIGPAGCHPVLDIADNESSRDVTVEIDRSSDEEMVFESAVNPPIPGFEMLGGEYDLVWDPELYFPRNVVLQGWLTVQRDSIIKGIDRLKGPAPFVRLFTFDGEGEAGSLAVALVKSRADAAEVDTVYIDRNRNFDLSDDEPIALTAEHSSDSRQTQWVAVQAHQGPENGDQATNPAIVRITTTVAKDCLAGPKAFGHYVTLERRGGWKGMIASNKGKVECAVVDANLTGIYGDKLAKSYDEEIYIDNNGLGRAIPSGQFSTAYQMVCLHPIVRFCSKFYAMKTNGIGSKLIIEPYNGPTGTVDVQEVSVSGMRGRADSIYARNEMLSTWINYVEPCVNIPGRLTELPAGDYHLSIRTVLTSPQPGNDLTLEPVVTIKDGENLKLRFVGDMNAAISPDVEELVWQAGSRVQFFWRVRFGDSTKVTWRGSAYVRPELDFIDASGKSVRITDYYEYSRDSRADSDMGFAYSLTVPKLEPGVYIMQLTCDNRLPGKPLVCRREVRITE